MLFETVAKRTGMIWAPGKAKYSEQTEQGYRGSVTSLIMTNLLGTSLGSSSSGWGEEKEKNRKKTDQSLQSGPSYTHHMATQKNIFIFWGYSALKPSCFPQILTVDVH